MRDGNGKLTCDSGVKADGGDVISMELDADAGTLTFRKNDTEEIGTVKGIKRGKYCVAVSMYHVGQWASFE